MAFGAAVPSSANLGASAASPDGETWDDFGYGERLAMAVRIWWVEALITINCLFFYYYF